MSKITDITMALSETDLKTPSPSRIYPLGKKFVCVDSDYPTHTKEFIYVKSHSALTSFQPYVLNYTGANYVITKAPATQTQGISLVVVPQQDFSSGYYGWVQIKGVATVKVGAETYAVGDPLEVLNTATVFNVNGTSGTALIDNKTSAIALEAGTTAKTISAYLIGDRVQIASS